MPREGSGPRSVTSGPYSDCVVDADAARAALAAVADELRHEAYFGDPATRAYARLRLVELGLWTEFDVRASCAHHQWWGL
jgi:hypothetical protein